jgi:DnaJ-class molecular chaperone
MSLSVNDYIKYDLYQVFLLNKNNFTLSLLRKAYQRQVFIYHPDKFPSDLPEEKAKEMMSTFLLINNSYTILSNNILKEEYDNKREAYLNEEKGFGSLKSQFYEDKVKNKLSSDEFEKQRVASEMLFKKNMEEMNSEAEKLSINISNTGIREVEVLDSNDSNLLKSESIKPQFNEDFNNELSNITANRSIKLDNNNTELYSGLGGPDTGKYAFIDDVFK